MRFSQNDTICKLRRFGQTNLDDLPVRVIVNVEVFKFALFILGISIISHLVLGGAVGHQG